MVLQRGAYLNQVPDGIYGSPGKEASKIGLIYKTNFPSLQGWGTPVGTATWTPSASGGIVAAAGNGGFIGNYISLPKYTNTLERWKMICEFVVLTTGAGVCVGHQSIVTTLLLAGLNRSWFGRWATTATLWGNNITTFLDGTGTTGTGLNGTAVDAAYAVNDVIRMTVERNGLTYSHTTLNVTTGVSKSMTYTLTIPAGNPVAPNNGGYPVVMSISGSQRFTYFEFSSECYKDIRACFIGASNTGFLRATVFPTNRYPNKWFEKSNRKFEVMAGGNDRTRAYTGGGEILKILNPDYTIIEMGSNDSNDVAGGFTTDAIWQAEYDQIRENVIAARSMPIHLTPIPRNDLNLFRLDRYIRNKYPKDVIIPFWRDLSNPVTSFIKTEFDYGDGLHLNDLGHAAAARIGNHYAPYLA